MGKEDLGPPVLREVGEVPIHGVHMKPASPTGIGFVGSTPVLLAPGYPISALVAWDMFGRRITQRLAGAPVQMPYRSQRARLKGGHRKPGKRAEIQRVVMTQDQEAQVLKGGSALLSRATGADGFVIFDAGIESVPDGAEVLVHLYD